jgi:hypothetical protein
MPRHTIAIVMAAFFVGLMIATIVVLRVERLSATT